MSKHFAILAKFQQGLIDYPLNERAVIGQDKIDGGSKIKILCFLVEVSLSHCIGLPRTLASFDKHLGV
jgi:hypothetical protein